jgi:hypothetical protein
MLGFDNVLARLDGLAYGGCFPNLRPGGRLDGASDSFAVPFSRLLTAWVLIRGCYGLGLVD